MAFELCIIYSYRSSLHSFGKSVTFDRVHSTWIFGVELNGLTMQICSYSSVMQSLRLGTIF
jgi:hypothetical protein